MGGSSLEMFSGKTVREIGCNEKESSPHAASEKELGNEYFKQKKYNDSIDCYSRSIALSPTAVAFANRAMAYLKIKRYEEAENDCTEALNLDDRYIKAYSLRATARRELGKLKASLEDSEFALRLEPHNQKLKKQHAEAKGLYDKAQKGASTLKAGHIEAVPPVNLPKLFGNALSTLVLIDIVKCVATFFMEDTELSIGYLENLTKV
ncbi:hypothetical protein GIB67_003197 [Kingdonia uniflora]|uniref:RNA-polymerase II-associated protein 3-like C-terminal domain-containing protein n=1 Tax=Kingdonia uniflora TaxID=39325 RepID=A0A7J7N5H8_9MAGN|nr:hypothetical protein GIB67_003197 [Kingdonia uniflora]